MAIYERLDEGAYGALTRYLQVLLCAHGDTSVIADGRFGSNTKIAVTAFQTAHRLLGNGVVDFTTWEVLQKFALPYITASSLFPIREGHSGAIVCQLQTLLRSHYSNVIINGYFDAKITELVRQFQRKCSLTNTGIVDPYTWSLLRQKILRLGDAGEKVQDLQFWLRKHGYILPINSTFDEATLIAVMDFQQRYGLPIDGLVGFMTWVILAEAVPSVPHFVQLTELCLSYTQLQQPKSIEVAAKKKLNLNP
jgi:peptidoglycan hydrolase-like protein with peptidoglycan-binding domain